MDTAGEITVRKDVPYVQNGAPRQVCDIYFPPIAESNGSKSSTVVIYVHGGGWVRGEKSAAEIPCTLLAVNGYHCIAPSYTLADEKLGRNYTVCLKDLANVIAWSHTPNATSVLKFTPKNIFLVGHSAGGHLISMAVLQKKWLDDTDKEYENTISSYSLIRGVVGLGGVYEVSKALDNNKDFADIFHQSFGNDRTKWYKHSPSTCDLEISPNGPIPISVATIKDYEALPQFLLIHSHEDEIVEIAQTTTFLNRFDFSEDDSDTEEYSPKIQFTGGHFGFHHDMYKKEDLIHIIIEFIEAQLSL